MKLTPSQKDKIKDIIRLRLSTPLELGHPDFHAEFITDRIAEFLDPLMTEFRDPAHDMCFKVYPDQHVEYMPSTLVERETLDSLKRIEELLKQILVKPPDVHVPYQSPLYSPDPRLSNQPPVPPYTT